MGLSAAAVLTSQASAEHVRAMLMGNSYTNQTWESLEDFVDADPGSSIDIVRATASGQNLQWHWDHRNDVIYTSGLSLVDMLATDQWDVVVIQGHSLGATVLGDPVVFQEMVQNLSDLIRLHAPSAEIHLFETWARRSDNDWVYPDPFLNPEFMQAQVRENYTAAAALVKGILDPVGDAWELASQLRPYDPSAPDPYTLHTKDTSHPSENGRYLTGAVFYERLFGRVSIGSNYLGGLSSEDALFLQQVATWTSGVCPGDITGDANVTMDDLLAMIAAWGQEGGIEDVNDDGTVDMLDLLGVLASWGSCP
jgi:hypothetical protein